MAKYRYNPTLAYAAGSHPAYYSKSAIPKDRKQNPKGKVVKTKTIHCARCEDPHIKKSSDKLHVSHSARCPKRLTEKETHRSQKQRPQKLHGAKVRNLKLNAAIKADPTGTGAHNNHNHHNSTLLNASLTTHSAPTVDPRTIGQLPWDYADSTQRFHGTGYAGWGTHTTAWHVSGNRSWGRHFNKFDWEAFEWAHFGTVGRLDQPSSLANARDLEPWHGELVDGMCWRPEPANGRRLTVCYYNQDCAGAPLIEIRPEHLM